MTQTLYIGIDDTDIVGSPGTGKVARGLAKHLEELHFGTSLGVSRHQLLVDPRIPYTSHNSCKGLAFHTNYKATELCAPCLEYIQGCLQYGADPGLCIVSEDDVTPAILAFGKRAIFEVLTKEEARRLANEAGAYLKEVGGSGDGIIGALDSVGLRASGDDGRLVDLRGIREVKGILTVAELLSNTDIDSIISTDGNILNDNEIIDTMDRVRPELLQGKAVLKVALIDTDTDRRWRPVEALRKKYKENGHE